MFTCNETDSVKEKWQEDALDTNGNRLVRNQILWTWSTHSQKFNLICNSQQDCTGESLNCFVALQDEDRISAILVMSLFTGCIYILAALHIIGWNYSSCHYLHLRGSKNNHLLIPQQHQGFRFLQQSVSQELAPFLQFYGDFRRITSSYGFMATKLLVWLFSSDAFPRFFPSKNSFCLFFFGRSKTSVCGR